MDYYIFSDLYKKEEKSNYKTSVEGAITVRSWCDHGPITALSRCSDRDRFSTVRSWQKQ